MQALHKLPAFFEQALGDLPQSYVRVAARGSPIRVFKFARIGNAMKHKGGQAIRAKFIGRAQTDASADREPRFRSLEDKKCHIRHKLEWCLIGYLLTSCPLGYILKFVR